MTSWWKQVLHGDDPPMASVQSTAFVPSTVAVPSPDLSPAPTSAARADAAAPTGAELRARVAAISRTKYREGYDITQVDAFTEQAAATLDAHAAGLTGPLTPDDVLRAKFQATKFRDGYDQDEVDDLLDVVVNALRR